MTSYYPLLPTLVTSYGDAKICPSTTFLNYPNNIKKRNYSKLMPKSVYVGVYCLSSGFWHLSLVQECKYGEFLTVSRDSVTSCPDQTIVLVVRRDTSFPEQTRYLPEPHALNVDSSPSSHRASLTYSLGNSSTAYLGEYPFAMSCRNAGTFWTFDGLKHISSSPLTIDSFLILMNILRDGHIDSHVDLAIFDPLDRDHKVHISAKKNSFTVLDLRKINSLLSSDYSGRSLFVQSSQSLFIPMVLNSNQMTNQLSFEHMHPPDQLFWGRHDTFFASLIKRTWS